MQRKNGIISFVDILGYSSFMENNDVGEQLGKVLDIMTQIPHLIKGKIIKEFPGNESAIDTEIQEMTDRIENLIVSDSILTMMEFKTYDDKTIEGIQWMIFIWYMSFMQKEFMDYGLPLRGAISFGEYMTVGNSFAGKPIIEAYKLGNKINSSGIQIDKLCEDLILQAIKVDLDFFKNMIMISKVNYQNKNNQKEQGYFISISFPYEEEERTKLSNKEELIIYLTTSFTAHSKTLNKGGELKLRNTIDLYFEEFEIYNE